MMAEVGVWRAANLLIREHGIDAELEAAKRADLMLNRGDDEGRPLSAQIREALEVERMPAMHENVHCDGSRRIHLRRQGAKSVIRAKPARWPGNHPLSPVRGARGAPRLDARPLD